MFTMVIMIMINDPYHDYLQRLYAQFGLGRGEFFFKFLFFPLL